MLVFCHGYGIFYKKRCCFLLIFRQSFLSLFHLSVLITFAKKAAFTNEKISTILHILYKYDVAHNFESREAIYCVEEHFKTTGRNQESHTVELTNTVTHGTGQT